jgi:PAS domain S-box-containing protein
MQTHQLLNLALEGGRVGTWYWHIETNELEWSDLCKKYLALPEGNLPSFAHFYAVLHPEDRERVRRLISHTIENKLEQYQTEYRVVYKDGNICWLSAFGRVFMNEYQQPYAMAGTLTDITPIKSSEAHLARFQQIYESALMGIAISDMQGKFQQCNPAFTTMIGYSEEELRTMNFVSLIHPDDRDHNMVKVKRLLLGEVDHFTIENRYRHREGQSIWVRKSISLLLGPSGVPTHMLALINDITEYKESEERLAKSQHFLDLALAGSELGIWDTDMLSGASYYDERYCAMLGYQIDELEPTMEAWQNLIHPDDRVAVNEAIRAHLAGETRVYEIEHRLHHKDGHWIWGLARGKLTYNDQGEPIRATGTLQDITDRKRVTTEGASLLHKIEELLSSLNRPDSAQEAPVPHFEPVTLTARQREVLILVAEGLTANEIAERLHISPETVVSHRRMLMRRLGVKNKTDLIRYAMHHNIS